MKRFSLKKL